MKKIITLFIVLSLLTSCNKDSIENNTQNNQAHSALEEQSNGRNSTNNLNAETLRILSEINNPDYTVAIIDNPNYGAFSPDPKWDIIMSGESPSDVSITIDGDQYQATSIGQWLKQSLSFKNYYGKTVNVSISQQENVQNFSFYVPSQITVQKLSSNNSLKISRTSDNILNWTPDTNNSSGKVALHYQLYNQSNLNSASGMYFEDILLLDDNGSFSLNNILSDLNCKKVLFYLISGNTASMTLKNQERLLFQISTYDTHEYIVD